MHNKDHDTDQRAKDSQKFGRRLVEVLGSKRPTSSENHWELILGFIFFFGGIYLIFNFLFF
jgi:hypothetical protein